jgi:hypothetical protein
VAEKDDGLCAPKLLLFHWPASKLVAKSVAGSAEYTKITHPFVVETARFSVIGFVVNVDVVGRSADVALVPMMLDRFLALRLPMRCF